MEGTSAVTLINSVGFPIAAFLLMFWQNTTIIKANTSAMEGLKESIQKSNEGK